MPFPPRSGGFCLDPNAEHRLLDIEAASEEHPCRGVLGDACPALEAHGLLRLAVLRYIDATGGSAVVSARYFRFTNGDGAYAQFTSMTLGEEHPSRAALRRLDVPGQAVLRGGEALLWNGAVVVQASLSDERSTEAQALVAARNALPSFAADVARRFPEGPELPNSVRWLPAEERVGDVRYRLNEMLGVAGVGPSALGFYERPPRRYVVSVSELLDPALARDVERTLLAQPGRHSLEDMPFEAFELSVPGPGGSQRWLVGRYQDRIVGIGDDTLAAAPLDTKADRDARALTRGQKVLVLQRVLSRRAP